MLRIFFLFTLTMSFVVQGFNILNENDVSSHLNKYAQIIETHHDNIADTEHTHSHKHSEDGEEHEHHHDHMGSTPSNLKLINTDTLKIINEPLGESVQNFSYQMLASSNVLFPLFRPPIV